MKKCSEGGCPGSQCEKTGAACGAFVTGVDLTQDLSDDIVAKFARIGWKTKCWPFLISRWMTLIWNGSPNILALSAAERFSGILTGMKTLPPSSAMPMKQRRFLPSFHSDWSFLDIPPAGTCLFGITIPPIGGNTLFADQVAAYERLPDNLRDKADSLTAIHSAELAMRRWRIWRCRPRQWTIDENNSE